jgi:hypothetical protein
MNLVPANLRPRMRAQAPFVTVLAIALLSFLYLLVQPAHWRRGTSILAIAMLLAGAFRLILSRPRAGLLAVRTRWFDAACYILVGVLILITDIRLHS